MPDHVHQKLMLVHPTLSLPILEDEINHLSALIDRETDLEHAKWLCAAYQALKWARNPDAYAAPSEC